MGTPPPADALDRIDSRLAAATAAASSLGARLLRAQDATPLPPPAEVAADARLFAHASECCRHLAHARAALLSSAAPRTAFALAGDADCGQGVPLRYAAAALVSPPPASPRWAVAVQQDLVLAASSPALGDLLVRCTVVEGTTRWGLGVELRAGRPFAVVSATLDGLSVDCGQGGADDCGQDDARCGWRLDLGAPRRRGAVVAVSIECRSVC